MTLTMAIKLDPNRPQKVFTAEQVLDALAEAFCAQQSQIRASAKAQGRSDELIASLMFGQLSSSLTISEQFCKALGMTGPNGPYLDKDQS